MFQKLGSLESLFSLSLPFYKHGGGAHTHIVYGCLAQNRGWLEISKKLAQQAGKIL